MSRTKEANSSKFIDHRVGLENAAGLQELTADQLHSDRFTLHQVSILLALARFGVLGEKHAPKGIQAERKFGDYMLSVLVKTTKDRHDSVNGSNWRENNPKLNNKNVLYDHLQVQMLMDDLSDRHQQSISEDGLDQELLRLGLIPEVLDFAKELNITTKSEDIIDSYSFLVTKAQSGELMHDYLHP